MLKSNEEYSQDEKFSMILEGSSFAVFVANHDRDLYKKYILGEEQELSDYDSRSMKVLSILSRLGYPMNELGTYLYKEVITEVCDALKDVTGKRTDMEQCKSLLAELSDGFSQLYHNVAREYLEMGIIPFHLNIEKSIENINPEAIDLDLSYQIFGSNPEEQNYGLQAFQLAAYTLGFYAKKEVQPPVVKRLSNIPDNLRLKSSL